MAIFLDDLLLGNKVIFYRLFYCYQNKLNIDICINMKRIITLLVLIFIIQNCNRSYSFLKNSPMTKQVYQSFHCLKLFFWKIAVHYNFEL